MGFQTDNLNLSQRAAGCFCRAICELFVLLGWHIFEGVVARLSTWVWR